MSDDRPPGVYVDSDGRYTAVVKPGAEVRVTDEQITVDRMLSTRTMGPSIFERYQRQLIDLIFGPPWTRPDTWRGWPTRFAISPRVDAAQRFVDDCRQLVTELAARLAYCVDVLRTGVPDPDDYR